MMNAKRYSNSNLENAHCHDGFSLCIYTQWFLTMDYEVIRTTCGCESANSFLCVNHCTSSYHCVSDSLLGKCARVYGRSLWRRSCAGVNRRHATSPSWGNSCFYATNSKEVSRNRDWSLVA